MRVLRRLVEHPLLNAVVALVLVGTSLAEGWETLSDDLVTFDLHVHHGVLLFGFVNLLRAIPELFEAAERMNKAAADKTD